MADDPEILDARPAHDGVLYKAAPKPPRTVGERSAVFVMTSQDLDRHGDVVVTKGVDTTEFERNPVLLLNHNSRALPIGAWGDLARRPKRIEGRAQFIEEGVTSEADAAWSLVAKGVLRGASIGFRPLETEYIRDADDCVTGYKIVRSELIECSVVTIPANSAALAKAMDEGVDIATLKYFAEQALDSWMPGPDGAVMPRKQAEAMWREIGEKAGVAVFAASTGTGDLSTRSVEMETETADPPPDLDETAPQAPVEIEPIKVELDAKKADAAREDETLLKRIGAMLRRAGLSVGEDEPPAPKPVKGGRARARDLEARLAAKTAGLEPPQ